MIKISMEEKTEGIVLHSFAFQENSRILKIFSPDLGIFSLIVKNISLKKPLLLSLTTPFSHAEFVYKKGKNDLLLFTDGSLIDNHLFLRQDFDLLHAASKMNKCLLDSQWAYKKSPALFVLFKNYLKAFQKYHNTQALLSSFYLKLLLHEGLVHLSLQCNRCSKPSIALDRGESLCSLHAQSQDLQFTEEEFILLCTLARAKKFQILQEIPVFEDMKNKIETLFLNQLKEY
jgi:DNA repair protein RecO